MHLLIPPPGTCTQDRWRSVEATGRCTDRSDRDDDGDIGGDGDDDDDDGGGIVANGHGDDGGDHDDDGDRECENQAGQRQDGKCQGQTARRVDDERGGQAKAGLCGWVIYWPVRCACVYTPRRPREPTVLYS